MAYKWRILRSAVEQEILFPSEADYESYLAKFHRDEIPYEIVNETENEDGTYTAVLRKPYNNNEFFRREPEMPDDEFKAFVQRLFKEEAEAISREVESDPSLKDVKMPEDSYEQLMAKIREMEKRDT